MAGKSNNKHLWAPWRMEYVKAPKARGCFLCGREKPSRSADERMVIARGEDVFVLLNAFPYNSGHLLVSPYGHVNDISLLSKKTLAELMDYTIKAKETLVRLMRPNGFNIGFNLGAAAGAGLEDHIHMHIVPRWAGDTNFMPVLGDVRVVPQALKDTAALIKNSWGQ